MKKIILITLSLLFVLDSLACSAPRKGRTFDSFEELVDKTDQIVLATFKEIDDQYFLEVIETIKGEVKKNVKPPYIKYFYKERTKNLPYLGYDFNNHTNKEFWAQRSSRVSGWKSGSCWPTFTFKNNDQYLIFVDSYASYYGAELIKSREDKWYLFVKNRVSNTHNKSLNKDAAKAAPIS